MKQMCTLSKVESELVKLAYEAKTIAVNTAEQTYQSRLQVAAISAGVPKGTKYTIQDGADEGTIAVTWEDGIEHAPPALSLVEEVQAAGDAALEGAPV